MNQEQNPSDMAKLVLPNGDIDLPIVHATEGYDGVQLGALLKETGTITLDNGYVNTGSCESCITYIDGDKGILRYRGYPIEELAEKATFMEVAYLLIHGHLPNFTELEDFRMSIKYNTELDWDFRKFYEAIPRWGHPMPSMAAAVNLLSCYNQDCLDPHNPGEVEKATRVLLGQVPMLTADIYRHLHGMAPMYPRHEYTLVENFLRMMFGSPSQEYELDPELVHTMEVLLILHADHEQNCSTSTVRMVGSSKANLFVSVAAGIDALYGPLHGGANQAVLEMLEGIRDSGGDAHDYMERVKNKEDGVRLMGFGHRVYKNYDPRAAIVKKHAHRVIDVLGGDELLDIALALEDKALADDYFVERRLYPNVDFYTGLIYRAMGFPTQMFTPLFVFGRLPGWIAQWREQNSNPHSKIGRPRHFGHRVYKNYDPRAAIVKKHAHRVIDVLGGDELLDIALALEDKALADDYFVERRLYPNVDFYTGLIYRAMGFPTQMFTPLFVFGRLPGWIAQWREQNSNPHSKIGRPRQVYKGETERAYVPLEDRQ